MPLAFLSSEWGNEALENITNNQAATTYQEARNNFIKARENAVLATGGTFDDGVNVRRIHDGGGDGKAPRKLRFSALSAFVIALQVVFGCSEEGNPPKPDIPFLTSDGYFLIGGQHITVPMIALRGPEHVFTLSREEPAKTSKEILREQATDPNSPMPVDSLNLLIHQYEMRDQHGASTEVCPPLTRLWAQVVCRGQQKGVLKRVPEKFDLLDRTKLGILKSRYTVGGEQEYDQVSKMSLRPGVTEIGCDKDSKFCTAAVEAKPGLLAIWTVWSGEDQTAAEMADAQGAAIVQFVQRAVGPVEDKTLATTE